MSKLRNKTRMAFVLDASSSIEHYRLTDQLRNGFNEKIRAIRQAAKEHDQDISVSVFVFADIVRMIHNDVDINNLPELRNDYAPYGNTALCDGVGQAIQHLKSLKGVKKGDAFLVETMTDGEENRSQFWTFGGGYSNFGTRADNLVEELKALDSLDNWTFAFQVPRGKKSLMVSYGVPEGCVIEWEQTAAGAEKLNYMSNVSAGEYVMNRSRGLSKVAAYYCQTDASHLKPKDLAKKLNDISSHFLSYDVPKEMPVKEFIENRNHNYVIGCAFYLLMKKEKVQKGKKILIVEKGKKTVWGGPEARKLIGLVDGADAIVEPGNHANYDIYVQSTSVNRLLPRGTKVLFDKTLRKGLKPTWDHVAAATNK